MNNVSVIKPILNPSNRLKRVCGYARVSTIDEHQDTSYNTQISELEELIKSNPYYEFVGVFKDKKSGTNTKNREEFRAMIDLALLGEIDIIYTKSITRFARNLIDTISIIRKLKSHNVEVIFLKENLNTSDPTIGFLLTVLAVHAEEESKSISSNVKWSVKRKAQRGGNLTTQLYGYKIDGENWSIVESEAKVVKMIFDMYIKGKTYKEIINKLFKLNIKTSNGKDRWHPGTIEQMIQNEKYAGHMALGKTTISNGKVIKTNKDELYENMILNHHSPIVSDDTFNKALNLRKQRRRKKSYTYIPEGMNSNPFYEFVYSKENERYLRFVVEKPKGKYIIPTLFCYNNQNKNRAMLTVKNLFLILNDAINELSKNSDNLHSIFSEFINDNIKSCKALFDNDLENRVDILSNKASLTKSKKNILNYISRIKRFKESEDILEYRKIVYKVIINDKLNIDIKLSLNPLESLNLELISSSITLTIGNGNKELNYRVLL